MTPWGAVVAKQAQTPEGTVIFPEYEACRQLAHKKGVPIVQVYQAVQGANNQAAVSEDKAMNRQEEC